MIRRIYVCCPFCALNGPTLAHKRLSIAHIYECFDRSRVLTDGLSVFFHLILSSIDCLTMVTIMVGDTQC